MVKFSLLCDKAHSFEAWFQSNESFEAQKTAGHICCPNCASSSVRKALMAPNLLTPKTRARIPVETQPQGSQPAANTPASAPAVSHSGANSGASPEPQQASGADSQPVVQSAGDAAGNVAGVQQPNMQQMVQIVRKMHQMVAASCTDVGSKFADQARKMHEGDIEAKPIYGTSTAEEREEMAEDGIEFAQLPELPKDH